MSYSFLLGLVGVFAILWICPFHSHQASAESHRNPGQTQYILKRGDRLINLARSFDVSVGAILQANGLFHARDLRAGQKIIIPPEGTKVSKSKKRVLSGTYRVRRGETLSEIARHFGVSVDALLVANNFSSPKALQAEQRIIIPAPGQTKPSGEVQTKSIPHREQKIHKRREPPWMRKARKIARRLGLGSLRTAQGIIRGKISNSWIRAAGGHRIPSTLRFPVVGGWSGRGWGSGPGGYHLAFDISGKIGTRVNAAAPGIVAYANDEFAGFGKVVIIIHPGGLVTLYAHNSELKTVPGELVKKGTRIALLGSSGISRGPHVHFEVIYKGKLCDPVPLLRPRARAKNGRPIITKGNLISWPKRRGPRGAPHDLRCETRRRHPDYIGKPYGWRPDDWATRYRSTSSSGIDEADHKN